MYVEVSREEWLFRGLAIAMCLALVGMAVMPAMAFEESKFGYIASLESLALSIKNRDTLGIIYGSIGLVASVVSILTLPMSAPLWLILLAW